MMLCFRRLGAPVGFFQSITENRRERKGDSQRKNLRESAIKSARISVNRCWQIPRTPVITFICKSLFLFIHRIACTPPTGANEYRTALFFRATGVRMPLASGEIRRVAAGKIHFRYSINNDQLTIYNVLYHHFGVLRHSGPACAIVLSPLRGSGYGEMKHHSDHAASAAKARRAVSIIAGEGRSGTEPRRVDIPVAREDPRKPEPRRGDIILQERESVFKGSQRTTE